MSAPRGNSPYSTPAPTPTEARPACLGNWLPFDVLLERTNGPGFNVARREALEMCGGCALRPKCWIENKDEEWVQALVKVRRKTKKRDSCGTVNGARAHYRNRESACADCRAAEAERSRKRKAVA